jgi:hypothetical protein
MIKSCLEISIGEPRLSFSEELIVAFKTYGPAASSGLEQDSRGLEPALLSFRPREEEERINGPF